MKLTLLFLIVVIFNSTDIFSNEIYDGKLFLKNNTIIEAERITISKDTVFYNKIESTERYNITTNELNKLEVQDGTYKTLGLISGGFVGFSTYYLISGNDFDTMDAVVSTVFGLVLGGIVGEFTSRTRDILFSDQFSFNIISRKNPNLNLNSSPYYVMNLSINL